MRRRRWRTAVLWVGCVSCALIVVAFVASGWVRMAYQVIDGPFALTSMGVLVVGIDDQFPAGIFVERNPRWWGSWNMFRIGRYAWIPLWMLFAAIAIPTLLVWRFGSKPVKPGHCQCGYDLTGNTSGVCPECGVEVQA